MPSARTPWSTLSWSTTSTIAANEVSSPVAWMRVQRSDRTARASTTVAAGYSEVTTAMIASWPRPVAARNRRLAIPLSAPATTISA